jgi:uncharacterized protein YbjQ (UPF0145 family)
VLLSTTENIPGREYTVIGLVKGATVQSKHVGRDIMAGLKTIVGGELIGYTEMMNEARAIATRRMTEDAQAAGADAIVAIRYASAAVTTGAAEIVAYGTAVKFKQYS